jgi:hypothetical protein
VQPFSNFAGDVAMCQVIFAGTGMTNHMCPPVEAENINNLLVSVNEKGSTTGETLHAAYKYLTIIIAERKGNTEGSNTDIIIADGHKSRFNSQVMEHCDENFLSQFILPPDTSGITQKHDQINQLLHASYESKKSEMYSEYSDINKECFEYFGRDLE